MTGLPAPRELVLLGSTGSIGTQALDVVARAEPGRFRVVGLSSTGRDPQLLAAQVAATGAEVVAVSDAHAVDALRALVPTDVKVLGGPEASEELSAWPCHTVLNGVAGLAGLRATLTALRAGRTVALANKESLIAGGPLVQQAVGTDRLLDRLLPVDSEHSALWQCLAGARDGEVARLVLTASGGPFRGRRRASLRDVTPADALAHPTWDMGPLVTVNSATLVNKGLEMIEAQLLFGDTLPGDPYDAIDVVVHPQSLVHSMVTYVDGSTIAQISPPDMRLPIAIALGWPERVTGAAPAMDWTAPTAMTFEPLDDEAFPSVGLARAAGRAGGTAPAVFAAANEEAVAAFLAGNLPFLGIVDTIDRVLSEHAVTPTPTLEDVLEAERWARARAQEVGRA
ncbi:MAG TPA: 1-deoxy-D-xylulose-5-phosphate reductoisomerase [Mycobacteriales bacterium]|nr:1-deoxy-D-xylulose-5-phosphate reductoisomerase [Mycobacteriales bacterium]